MTLTLQDYQRLYGEKAVLEHFEKKYPQSYESFLKTVHACIDKAVVEAQRAAQYLFDSSEDHITTFIVSNLRGQGIDADHDSDSGGHVDIFIEDADKNYSWAAEAKIDTDWSWIEGGVGQLMDRYADGIQPVREHSWRWRFFWRTGIVKPTSSDEFGSGGCLLCLR